MRSDSTVLIDQASELCACVEHLADEKRTAIPLSTYRPQFNSSFHFEDARRLVPYLSRLGITHCYASPILKARYGRRIQQYMEKAVHEAKVNLSWLNPNPEYVAGMNSFIERILAPCYRGKPNLFWDSLQKFLPAAIYFGAMNSLSQTMLKLTSPGVPDIYQGQEMWDFSLVDPDNRRPVDFNVRTRSADELCRAAQTHDLREVCRDLLLDYRDGRLKLWVIMLTLNFRRRHQDLFRMGSYLPLHATRGREEHVLAFARQHEGELAIVAAPRLSYTLMKGREEAPVSAAWGDAELTLPPEAVGRQLRNIFTGERLLAGESMLCREVFGVFPVALLTLD